MKRIIAAAVTLAALGACGDGNPFTQETEEVEEPVVVDEDPAAQFVIPEAIASSLTSITYDPEEQTLSLVGLQLDEDTEEVQYRRREALDKGPYEAYTAQDDPLDEHTTVYVRRLGDVEAAVAVTGGQFGFFSGGVTFSRDGAFDPIAPDAEDDRGLASYAGDYIGLVDVQGPRTDLLVPNIPDEELDLSATPGQAGFVEGKVLINVEFGPGQVKGEVFDRTLTGIDNEFNTIQVDLPDLLLEPSTLDADGNFAGNVEVDDPRVPVGQYAGTIGSEDSDSLAGGLYASDHFGDAVAITDEEEYGIFVLGRCAGTLEDEDTTYCTDADN